MERKQITKTVLVALFAALVAAGAFIKIPFVPVPMTLQTLFALLAAACLPPSMAVSSIVIYIFLGAIGLPILTAGGGLAAVLGPTGGYLFGMIPGVLAGSALMKAIGSRIRLASLLSAIVTTVFIYLVGLPWLSWQMELSFASVLAAGLVPFIPGDILKIVVVFFIAPVIQSRVKELLERE